MEAVFAPQIEANWKRLPPPQRAGNSDFGMQIAGRHAADDAKIHRVVDRALKHARRFLLSRRRSPPVTKYTRGGRDANTFWSTISRRKWRKSYDDAIRWFGSSPRLRRSFRVRVRDAPFLQESGEPHSPMPCGDYGRCSPGKYRFLPLRGFSPRLLDRANSAPTEFSGHCLQFVHVPRESDFA